MNDAPAPRSVWLPPESFGTGVDSFGLLGDDITENESGECRQCSRPTTLVMHASLANGSEFVQHVCAEHLGPAAEVLQRAQEENGMRVMLDAAALAVLDELSRVGMNPWATLTVVRSIRDHSRGFVSDEFARFLDAIHARSLTPRHR
jgi:hypothetical protein